MKKKIILIVYALMVGMVSLLFGTERDNQAGVNKNEVLTTSPLIGTCAESEGLLFTALIKCSVLFQLQEMLGLNEYLMEKQWVDNETYDQYCASALNNHSVVYKNDSLVQAIGNDMNKIFQELFHIEKGCRWGGVVCDIETVINSYDDLLGWLRDREGTTHETLSKFLLEFQPLRKVYDERAEDFRSFFEENKDAFMRLPIDSQIK